MVKMNKFLTNVFSVHTITHSLLFMNDVFDRVQ